jgi:DNA-binding MarR family transcriptional regulator
MEQDGYVERRPDATDERVSRVSLLQKGRAVVAEIYHAFGVLDRGMFFDMTDTDLARLRELLTQMHANLQEVHKAKV